MAGEGSAPISRSAVMATAGAMMLAAVTVPANAQEVQNDPWAASGAVTQNGEQDEAGHTAETGAGEVGQRQTVGDAAAMGFEPMGRVNSRINNRVESRIRNRIDRNYNPEADATSSIEAAASRSRRGTRR